MDRFLCPFEKTILSLDCACENAERAQLGERVVVVCCSHLAHANCTTFLGLMQEKSRFLFKQTRPGESLPFGKQKKVLYGSLLGLASVLGRPTGGARHIDNIHQLVVDAISRFGSLAGLPYDTLMQSVAGYQPRRRARPWRDHD